MSGICPAIVLNSDAGLNILRRAQYETFMQVFLCVDCDDGVSSSDNVPISEIRLMQVRRRIVAILGCSYL